MTMKDFDSESLDTLNTLKTAFDSLQGTLERQAGIHALYAKLQTDEVREIGLWANAQPLKRDIVGGLPVELVTLIFKHLHINMMFRCQSVNKAWAEVLRSDDLLSSMLQQKNVCKVPELDFPPNMSQRQRLVYTAQSINAHQHGRPFSRTTGSWHMPSEFESTHDNTCLSDHRFIPLHDWPKFKDRIAYCKERLAWIDSENGDHVVVLSIKSGNKMTWRPGNRPVSLRMSEDIMVVSTNSVFVYVHDFATGVDHSFRLPSGDTFAVDLVRETVAVLLLQSSHCPRITTWTLSEKVACKFPVTMIKSKGVGEDDVRSYRMMIDPLQSSILYIKAPQHSEILKFERYDLKGMQIAKGEIRDPKFYRIRFRLPQDVTFSSETLGIDALWYYQPSKLFDLSYMENRRKQYGGDEKEAFPTIARFVFDLDRNKLRYEEFEEFRGTAHRVDKTFTFVVNGNAYTAYGTGAYQRHLGCASIHANETYCAERLDSACSGHPLEVIEEGLKGFWLLGDEKFLIRASYNGYAVFCFDPFVIMVNQDMAYNAAQVGAQVEALGKRQRERLMKYRRFSEEIDQALKDQEEGNKHNDYLFCPPANTKSKANWHLGHLVAEACRSVMAKLF